MKGDTGNEPLYKQFAHDLSQLNNEIKKLEQAMNQAMQKNGADNGVPAETQAKIQAIAATTKAKIDSQTALTGAKLKQKELADRQKARHKDAGFVKEQHRKDVGTVAEIGRSTAKGAKKPLEE